MIRSLQLGNETFPVNLVQGPLAGVSCAPFRRLTWQYSQPAFSYTEMISCKTLLQHRHAIHHRYTHKARDEGPVCFQLAGNNPFELAEATKIATDLGADLIDLNCGCPVKKIRQKQAGSSLLTDHKRLYQLMVAMKQHTHVPVSIKIRVEGLSHDNFNQGIAAVVNEAGIDFLTVHGRHWLEDYSSPCHYQDIAFFVQEVKKPVIGNGDIRCLTSLKKMLATGCAGVMIARAGLGQPWLIGQLLAQMQQHSFTIPSTPLIGNIFFEHVLQLTKLISNEKKALLEARKFGKYYARHLIHTEQFSIELNACRHLQDLERLCTRYFV